MQTQIEKLRQENRDYNKTMAEESLGKYPSYFVTATQTLASQTSLKPFYFRVRINASVNFTNDRSGQAISTKDLLVGEEFWGDFSLLEVDSGDGELFVYVK